MGDGTFEPVVPLSRRVRFWASVAVIASLTAAAGLVGKYLIFCAEAPYLAPVVEIAEKCHHPLALPSRLVREGTNWVAHIDRELDRIARGAAAGDAADVLAAGLVAYYGVVDAPAAQYRGTPDFTAAAKWFSKGSTLGDPAAQYELGLLRLVGEGVPKDVAAASRLLNDAWEAEEPYARSFHCTVFSCATNAVPGD